MSLRTATRLPVIHRRTYAIASGHSSPKDRDSTAGDSRLDVIRKTLYPPTRTPAGDPSSPTGTYHPDAAARLAHVVGTEEVHETIGRAWNSHLRSLRERREAALRGKTESIQRACEALRQVDARLYAAAMVKPDIRKASAGLKVEEKEGKTSLAEKRWKASRMEGLVPRELGVPRETWAGERWRYEWRSVE